MNKLVLVPTPVGNLKDITLRAIEVIKEAELILCEDTRKTSNLLKHFEINAKELFPYHKFNEHKTTNNILEKIKTGRKVILVSDAGTPWISDPGFLIVRACIENNIEVECLPGPTALIPAIVNSGLPNDKFVFEGFLPQKKGRKKRLEILKEESRTIIFYESPYRLVKLLEQINEIIGDNRKACVSREISKIHEENRRDTISNLLSHYKDNPPKGEIVISLEGKT